MVGGSDGTNLRALATDNGGQLKVLIENTTPISGTVTANQGTPNSAANSWPVEITDGTNVLGTPAHPVRTDPTGTTVQPVSGTVVAEIEGHAGAILDAAPGATSPANAVQVGGTDGTNMRALLTDNTGKL